MDGKIIESKSIAIADVTCRGCRLPASVDANRLCEFCRRDLATVVRGDLNFPLPVIGVFVIAAIVFIVGVWLVSRI